MMYNFTPKRSLHLSLLIVGALEMCKPYRTSLELLVLKGFLLPKSSIDSKDHKAVLLLRHLGK